MMSLNILMTCVLDRYEYCREKLYEDLHFGNGEFRDNSLSHGTYAFESI